MISDHTIVIALRNLEFDDGWAASEADGITIWNRTEPQPTEAELVAAGWVKPTLNPTPEPEEETPTE